MTGLYPVYMEHRLMKAFALNYVKVSLAIILTVMAVTAESFAVEAVSAGRPPLPGEIVKKVDSYSPKQLSPQDVLVVDTVYFNFDTDLEGWGFLNHPDTVQEYYPDDYCVEQWRMISNGVPFSLSWYNFGGVGTARVYCPFRGYWEDNCDYSWRIKSINGSTPQEWDGVYRIQTRVYWAVPAKAPGDTIYAMIGYKRAGDTYFNYLGWTGPLPTYSWSIITINEPSPGAFANLEAVSILFGAYYSEGYVYVDWVRGIKNAPEVPTLVSPSNGAVIQNNLPTFRWSGDGDFYTLQIADNNDFGSPIEITNITSTQYTMTDPLPNSGGYLNFHYYWRVKGHFNSGAASSFSIPFTLDITGPHEVPSEFPTIRAAYYAHQMFSGGTVLVAPGTYSGPDNCNIGGFGEKPVDIVSSGGPDVTIIDCQGDYRGFFYDMYALGGTLLEGFTIRNANGSGDEAGAVSCWSTSPTIRNCIMEGGSVKAISCRSGARPRIENCIIRGNSGEGVSIRLSAEPRIVNCEISGNTVAGLYLRSAGSAIIESCTIVRNNTGMIFDTKYGGGDTTFIFNSIISQSTSGPAVNVLSLDNPVMFSCCDIFGNASGDWVGYIADQYGVNGNFSRDPLFCDFANDDYRITENSPCAPANNSCKALIGAYGVGCGAIEIVVSPTSIDFFAAEGEDNPPPDTLTITNAGGGVLTWMLDKGMGWLSVSDSMGTAPSIVIVSADISGLTAGVYTDTIIVIAEDAVNSPQYVPVTLTVQVAGEIALSPDSMHFSADSGSTNPEPQNLTITNTGGGLLTWTLSKDAEWLSVSDSMGTAPSTVIVSADISGLTAGIYADTIIVIAEDAVNSPQYVPVTLTVQVAGKIALSPDSMHFSADSGDANPKPQDLSITNTGGGLLTWTLSKDAEWLRVSDSMGTAPSTVTVTADISNLSPDQYLGVITVSSDNATNSPQYMPVTLTIDATNRSPEFVEFCSYTELVEGDRFECEIVVSDPDGDQIDFSCRQCPAGAELSSPGDTTALFSFEPDYRHVDGSYEVIIEASDGAATVSDSFTISVVNRELEVISIQPHSGENQDFLISWKPIEIQFNEALQESSLDNGLTIISRKGDLLNHAYDTGQYLLTFDNTSDYLMDLDTIICTLRTSILDMAENPLDSEYVYAFYTGVGISPGDANDDGIVDEKDILPMGLYWGNEGPSRPDSGEVSWGIKPAHIYASGKRWAPLASVYADADGSGKVDGNDICGVTSNWAQQTTSGKRSGQGEKADLGTALRQFEGNVLQQMYEALTDCPESEGKAGVMKMFESLLDEPVANLPMTYQLSQNYPNPFNPYTVIQFYLPQSGHATLSVYNIVGQKVAVLLDGYVEQGYNEVIWDGTDQSSGSVASGIYFYRLESREASITKRMMLLK
jgi:parallel beta-helix repeat protein